VALTQTDARRLGIDPAALNYTISYQTANGIVRGARVMLDEVKVGAISLRNVQASVTEGDGLGVSLLGMSFLGRLNAVEVRGERLVLRE
jgi:aspartyl protease family protein